MKLGIMQPYFLPYLGYFQLINSVDKFVIYDDVNFIKRGWINRNNFLINNCASLQTIPLEDASQFKLISEINLLDDEKWKIKFIRSIELAYKKAPFFEQGIQLIHKIIYYPKRELSAFLSNSLKEVSIYLGMNTVIVESSRKYVNNDLKGQDRILDICKIEKTDVYINLSGGMSLYEKDVFIRNGISLFFIQTNFKHYVQFNNSFIAGLSILDLIMFNSVEEINLMLQDYKLL